MFSFNRSILCMNECIASLVFDFAIYVCEKYTFPFYIQPQEPQCIDYRRVLCLKLIRKLQAASAQIPRRRVPRDSTLCALQALLIMTRRVIFVEYVLHAESAAEMSVVLIVESGCIILENMRV